MAPRKFGDFTLLEHLGTGGIGSVYRAEEDETGRIVAIKIFSPDDDHPPDQMRTLKEREVRMLVSVQHPNVVSFYGDGHVENQFYYAMEYVGDSLLNEMRSGREMSTLEKIRILRQSTNALQAIHNQGIVHRDVKPGNILLDHDPNEAVHAKVTDLGIARHVSEADIVRETTSKKIPGTPKYLSPEQIEQRALDGRSDIFGLGVLAYQLLSGEPPFQVDSNEEYATANCHQEPTPIESDNGELPHFINELVFKMLAKNREERYDSHTLARDLQLAEQHLVSGAELVEENDRQSIFYVPSEDEEETDELTALDRLLPVSKVLAGALVTLGICVGVYAWRALRPPPSLANASAGNPSAQPGNSPAALLDAVSDSVEAEQWWHAAAYLQQVKAETLKPEQKKTYDGLQKETRQALMPIITERIQRMVADERFAQAEATLARMEKLFLSEAQTTALEKRIEDGRAKAKRLDDWYEQWNAVTDLVEGNDYQTALPKLESLSRRAEGDNERVSLAKQSISDALNRWASELKDGSSTPSEMRSFLDVLHQYKDKGLPDLDVTAQTLSLRFKMAEYYEDHSRYENALDIYHGIISNFSGQPVELAREGRARAQRMLAREPMKTEDFARELQEEGFNTRLWYTQKNSAVTREQNDRTLTLTVPPSSSPPASSLTSRRPLANRGFSLSVDFKVLDAPDNSDKWQAGVEVADRRGRRIRVYFNGSQYTALRSYVLGGRLVSGGVPLGRAFGEEKQKWHRLSLEYRPGSETVAVLLDGEEVRELGLALDNCKIRIFLENQTRAPCAVSFRNPTCKP